MKPNVRYPFLLLLFFIGGFLSSRLNAQSETHNFTTYDTTLAFGSGNWNLRISRPLNMFTANNPDTASRPVIIFMVGSGEISNIAAIALYGPHYWLNNGWDGGIALGNGTHYPIIISVQPYTTGPTTRSTGDLVNFILNTYHIKRNAVHLTGLSMGAICWERMINAQKPGSQPYMKSITSITSLSGQGNPWGDSLQGAGWVLGGDVTVAPNWEAYGTWVHQLNGKYFALEGISDPIQSYLWMGTKAMNDSLNGSAYFSYYPWGHSGWNTMYNPAVTNWSSIAPLGPNNVVGFAANTMGNYHAGDYLFKYMLKQGDTALVGASGNSVPTVNAGAPQTITLPTAIATLSGSASDADGTIASYTWTQTGGTAAIILTPGAAVTSVTGLLTPGVRTFKLTVTDNSGATATSTTTITVNAGLNIAPTANAGSTQTITLPTATVTLAGSGSDLDGTIASYAWTQMSGTTATITSPAAAGTTITGLSTAGTRVFRLTVTDNGGSTGFADVTINVNPVGPLSETHDFITYDTTLQLPSGNWNVKVTRPRNMFVANNPDTASRPAIIFMVGVGEVGIGNFGGLSIYGPHYWLNNGWDGGITLTNGKHYPIIISVSPHYAWPSTRSAGEMLMFLVNTYHIKKNSVHITGLSMGAMTWGRTLTAERTPGDDTYMKMVKSFTPFEGNGTSYGSPAYMLGGDLAVGTDFSGFGHWAKQYGGKMFGLSGTNDFSGPSVWKMVEPMNDSLPGTGYHSYETIGGGSHCCWNSMYTPYTTDWTSVGTLPNYLTNAAWDGSHNSMGTYQTGDYVFKWMLKQGDTTLVLSSGNQSPTATAGSAQTITLPTSTVSLTGSGSDPDGTIASYAWSQVSGTAATITTPAAAATTITGLTTAGVRVFKLTVTDNLGATGSANVTITVNPANLPPTANAGSNQSITLPTSTTSLTGSGNDPDGTIASYTWTQVSGTAATIASPAASSTNIVGLTTIGVRVFRLKVTDNLGATATNDVTVTVNPALNVPPTANAGTTQTITLPLSTISLTGSGNDPDGTIASYAWTQLSGTTASITTAASASTTITGLTTAGTRVFRLTVTDNSGATGTADVTVIINPANISPTANAGTTQTITLPLSTVSLTGSGNDPDGTIASYAWTQLSGTTASITTAASASTTITGLTTSGTRVFRLTVTDNSGATGTADVTVIVNPANIAPIANAGTTQTITLPLSTVSLTGSGNDPDGTIASYAWTQLSGTTASITTAASASTTITGLTTTGTRVFRLTVTDNSGATGTADVTIIANPANIPPTANAGTTQSITLPLSTVTLTGIGSDVDGTIASYAWTQISGTTGTITDAPSASTTVTGLTTVGIRVFRLTVTDNAGATGTADVTINVNPAANIAPVANAGTTQTITLPVTIAALAGSGTDADGTIVSYAWSQLSGTTATIATPAGALTNITGLTIAGSRVFRLTVTDDAGATATSDVTVIVNPAANIAPTADAGVTQSVILPTSVVSLTGSGTDPDGTIISYAWTQISGIGAVITSPASSSTSITGLTSVGTRTFRLTVTDNSGATGTADVTIIVNPAINQAPIADAGTTQTITLPTSIASLAGSGTDADGTIASYAWTQISGTAATIVSASSSSTNITGLTSAGTRVFRLTVTDDFGATGTADVSVIVINGTNQIPVADAGTNQTITLPISTVSLTGSGNDTDGTIVSYAWTQISGTASTISSPASSSTTINGLTTVGPRVFKLTVTDDQGATASATVTVIVAPAGNTAPVAYAGPAQTITLPLSTVTLTGTGTDDGTIMSYGWLQVSGTAATITSPASATTTITGLTTPGIRIFRLLVVDDYGTSGISDVTIIVNPAANIAPTVNAGTTQTITLPTSSVSLTGSGSDADGTIASYTWTQISGTSAAITTPGAAATSITGLTTVGTRVFRLTVTDNLGASALADVTVIVNPAPNQAPTADAGIDQNITLPLSTVTLNGAGTDPDGTIASYTWTQVSGTAATIVTASSASTDITGLTTPGVRVFRLKVTDNSGATATDDVTITVNPAANQLPTADAGPAQSITLPTSIATLNGSGSDPDGTIVSYAWTQISGTAATITTPGSAATTISGLTTVGVRTFRLTVTDNSGATATDNVTVTVNPAANQVPTADAGAAQSITLPVNTVSLSGTGTDPDGTIASYAWTQISGMSATITSIASAATTITGLTTVGVRVFRLTVTDNSGATATDDVAVTVNALPNQAPTANAGAAQTITLPTSITTLAGSGSDPDGSIATYAWTQIGGTAAIITSPASATTTITGLTTVGVRTFRLTVTDNSGATASATVTVTVNPVPNQGPTANAGPAQTMTSPVSTATLIGSGTDPDGSIVSYAWTQISGLAAVIVSPASATTNITGLTPPGVRMFRLTVTDNSGATASDDVTITILPADISPIANAGPPQTIVLPLSTVTLTGSGTDADGTISSYAWTQLSGAAATITGNASAITTVTGLTTPGVRVFRLAVTDNLGAIGTATVTITVVAPANQPPVALAGINQTITYPDNTVTLLGSGTDADGYIVGYQWNYIGTAAQYALSAPSQAQTILTNLIPGVYQFELKVTDNLGATAKDTVSITVKEALLQSSAKLYPNPATTTINVEIDASTHVNKSTLKIYDLTGDIIYQEEFTRSQQKMIKQVDISRLPAGIYFLRVGVDINNEKVLRFVKS